MVFERLGGHLAACGDRLRRDRGSLGLVLLAVTSLFSCGSRNFVKSTQSSPQTAVPVVRKLSPADQQRFNECYLEAVNQQLAGRDAAAFDLYRHCLDINPDAAEAYYGIAAYYSQLKKDTLALVCLQRAADLNPSEDTYQETLAQYYISQQQYGKAIRAYEKLFSSNNGRTDVLSMLYQLYRQNKDFPHMLRTLQRIETLEGSSEEIAITKMNLYEQMGDKRQAYESLKALSDEHPNDLNYRVMLGNWLVQNGRAKDGYKLFAEAQREEPDNDMVQLSLYDYYESQNNEPLANGIRDRLLSSRKTPAKTKITILQQAIRKNEQAGGDSTEILQLLDMAMTSDPKDADLAEVKAAYMTLKKMPKDSVNNALRHILDIAPDRASARLQLIQNVWNGHNWDEILSLARPATQYNPEEMAFYYFMGVAYFQLDKRDEALDAFRRGIGEITPQSNPDFVSDFYSLMGQILHDKGKHDEAYAAYDSCLQWKPDNYETLNNYAYYLSVDNRDLKKAEDMSYRTIKAEPKNPTFLDTYAWVLFREERYAEAQVYIDQAIACDTDSVVSAVVLEHAGDIYACLNDIPKAVEFWQKAADQGDADATLLEKLKQKKYIKKEE